MQMELEDIQAKDLSNISQFAEGSAGYLLKATWRSGSKEIPVALKRTKTGNVQELLEEAKKLLELRHRNIAEAFGMCNLNDNTRCLVMELMEGGSLLSRLIGLRFQLEVQQLASIPHLMRFLLQIAEGMEFLESKGFIHRDIAARNILLTSSILEEANAKLGDFGLVKNLYSSAYYALGDNSAIPVAWSAPEVLEGLKKQTTSVVVADNCMLTGACYSTLKLTRTTCGTWQYSIKSDVWAFGVLIWEVITFGELPFADLTPNEIIKAVTTSHRCLSVPENHLFSKALIDLMLKTWTRDRDMRPTFSCVKESLESLNSLASTKATTSVIQVQNAAAATGIYFADVHERSKHGKYRYRGCLLGALVGSCFANYVMRTRAHDIDTDIKISDWLIAFLSSRKNVQYDIHFAFIKNVTDSLILKGKVDHQAIAKRMIELYGQKEISGGDNSIIRQLIHEWRENPVADVFAPAARLFNGKGSYGPMGCLNSIPVAMMLCHDPENAINECMRLCELTHAHPIALTNTAFLAYGIIHALGGQSFKKLESTMLQSALRVSERTCTPEEHSWFESMVDSMKSLAEMRESSSSHYFKIVSNKLESRGWESQILVGIFAFFKTCNSHGDTLDNPLLRSLVYASRSNGHFLITSIVAGALAGAYFGDRWISSALISRMEDSRDILESAEALYELSLKHHQPAFETKEDSNV